MNKILSIAHEQWIHRKLIWKLAIYRTKSKYANHYLGVFWDILQPALQVLIYYVVFGLGLRGPRSDIDDIPFIIYLISGIFPWLFISSSINSMSNAINGQMDLVTKMKFPASIFLTISFVNGLFSFLITTTILMVIAFIGGYSEPGHYIAVIYVLFATYALVMGIALIMSSLVIIIRDMRNVLQNIIRMLFFLTPIFWSLSEANEILQRLSSLNPFAYLIMNYRYAFVYDEAPLYGDMADHIYFWTFTLLLIFIGAQIYYRFKDRLVDYK